ncbi:FUSC family protein [Paeniglutamicibacter sp. NPDC012692]|uniref:FUSC family protein n=1 Tax=Paeniglutamicibacter sp. NPDC012692 TaxID=3364388 RepID=UPI0036A33761
MTGHSRHRGRWTPRVARTANAGLDVVAEAMRWKRTEINVLRMAVAGVSLGLPVTIGLLLGERNAGVLAALGALLVAGSGHVGNLRSRANDLLATAVVGSASLLAGMLCSGGGLAGSVVVIAVAAIGAVTGTIRTSVAKAGTQAAVFLIIGTSLSAGAEPVGALLATFAAGVLLGAALTLLSYGIEFHILGRRPRPPVGVRPWREDLAAWRRGLSGLDGWRYAIRLASCMLVAELFAHLVSGRHPYWILMTVVLVVQRDRSAALVRTTERALGTALGVLVGWWLLGPVPPVLLVGVVALIGACRMYLKSANYTAYALVMTPLIIVLGGSGSHPDAAFLRERLADTLIACLISLVIGTFPWTRFGPEASRARHAA